MKILSNEISESIIYVRTKKILNENFWKILGGEPPGGTGIIPRIELKDPTYLGKGSKGSKKIDLIAIKADKILLIELKRSFSYSDILKLNQIVNQKIWRKALMEALLNKRAFKRVKINKIPDFINNKKLLIKSIGLSQYHNFPDDFNLLIIKKDSYDIKIGKNCSISKEFFTKAI